MKTKRQNLISLAALFLFTPVLQASPVTVTGVWQFVSGTDLPGLDGTAFRYDINPGNPVSLYTFPSGSEVTTFAVGTRSLTLSGTTLDGTHAMSQVRQSTSLLDATAVDRLSLGGSRFELGAWYMEVPTITLHFDGDMITSPGIDTQPLFTANDINHIGLGSFAGSYGLQLWSDTHRLASYHLTDLSAAVVGLPVPSSLVLLLFGLLGLSRSTSQC